ncbi:MAG: hypothetical protein KVP17_001515 [Porospora cf. gigantea B]|uniref:uncharacterized protein n=1 Tax=Porospora cf. gigantea B TaxID=2853592 RepID=UPI0035719289|nr:MAG: hypothetical protein KVP17_001515 [Porospora cf. gigantea B]
MDIGGAILSEAGRVTEAHAYRLNRSGQKEIFCLWQGGLDSVATWEPETFVSTQFPELNLNGLEMRRTDSDDSVDEDFEESDIFTVERILKYRKVGDEEFVLIKWKHYSMHESTWEPIRNLVSEDALANQLETCKSQWEQAQRKAAQSPRVTQLSSPRIKRRKRGPETTQLPVRQPVTPHAFAQSFKEKQARKRVISEIPIPEASIPFRKKSTAVPGKPQAAPLSPTQADDPSPPIPATSALSPDPEPIAPSESLGDFDTAAAAVFELLASLKTPDKKAPPLRKASLMSKELTSQLEQLRQLSRVAECEPAPVIRFVSSESFDDVYFSQLDKDHKHRPPLPKTSTVSPVRPPLQNRSLRYPESARVLAHDMGRAVIPAVPPRPAPRLNPRPQGRPDTPVTVQERFQLVNAGGLQLKESALRMNYRLQSVYLSRRRFSVSSVDPSKLRCFCDRIPRKTHGDLLLSHFRKVAGDEMVNSVTCSLCLRRDHVPCALQFTLGFGASGETTLPASEELQEISRSYLCPYCCILLNDPWKVVDQVLDFTFLGPIRPSTNGETESTSSQCVYLSVPYEPALKDGQHALQLRGMKYRLEDGEVFNRAPYSCFPHEVTAKMQRGKGAQCSRLAVPIPEAKVDPPPRLKKRKDIPIDLPVHNFTQPGNLYLDCRMQRENRSATYLVSLVLAREVDANTLLTDLVQSSRITKELGMRFAATRIQADLAEADDECQVVTAVHDVSLKCIATHSRIGIPARSLRCLHVQCFDLDFFLATQRTVTSHVNRWKCIVCDKSCLPHEIIVDGFMQHILSQSTEDVSRVYLDVTEGPEAVTWRVTQRDDDQDDTESDDAAPPVDVVELD